MSSSLVTLARKVKTVASGATSLTISAVASAFSQVRAERNSSAPILANRIAIVCPKSGLAPVITIFLL